MAGGSGQRPCVRPGTGSAVWMPGQGLCRPDTAAGLRCMARRSQHLGKHGSGARSCGRGAAATEQGRAAPGSLGGPAMETEPSHPQRCPQGVRHRDQAPVSGFSVQSLSSPLTDDPAQAGAAYCDDIIRSSSIHGTSSGRHQADDWPVRDGRCWGAVHQAALPVRPVLPTSEVTDEEKPSSSGSARRRGGGQRPACPRTLHLPPPCPDGEDRKCLVPARSASWVL